MIEDISGVTGKLVASTLDALLLRHQVTAHNIANESTPNYSAKKVSFEKYLSNFSIGASNDSEKAHLSQQIDSLNALINDKQTLVYSTNAEVELDKEMVQLTETVLKYRALIEANSIRSQILGIAIKGRLT